MLNRIKQLFAQPDAMAAAVHEGDGPTRLAAACLLVQASLGDGGVCQDEEQAIRSLLHQRFDLSDEELDTLVTEAEDRATEANDLYGFTRVLKDALDYDERVAILEMLWEVVYADGHLDAHEDQILRLVGGLLYIEDRDRGSARKRVLTRLGIEH